MNKLLNSNFFYYILLVFIFTYILICSIILKNPYYKEKEYTITGKVIDLKKDDNKTSFIIKSKEKIKCYIYNNVSFNEGDTIKIDVSLSKPSNNIIPNTFNYKNYLYHNYIHHIGKVNNYEIIKKNKNIFINLKEKIKNYVSFNKYLKLFIIGDKTSLNDSYENYKDIGVAHLLAISGMHVSIFISITKKILFFLSNKCKNLIISLALLFYSFIVGFTASILRATLFFIINSSLDYFDIKVSKIKILIITIFILILFNPFIIFNIGFLYSFLCSLSIILIKKFLSKNYLKNLFIITLFTMLFTLPVTINLNYEINLIVFISNFILIPYVSLFLFPFALVLLFFPFLNNIFSFFCLIMEKIAYYLNLINFSKIIIPKFNIVYIIIYYIFLILFIYYFKKRYFIYLIIFIFFVKIIPFFNSNNIITFFDVGQGDSSSIITSFQKEVILIDTGGIINKNVSNNIILYFKSKGISKINYLILTHGDYDHMGDAQYLVNNIKVDKVIFNCGSYNDLEKDLIKVLIKKKIPYYSCIKELNIDNYKLQFLNTREYNNENDNSNVIYFNYNNYKFLFMGDAGVEVEEDLIEKYNLHDIDVLKVGHHGSKTSSSEKFVNEINPKYSIISVGKNNRYGHPNKEVLNNLENSKIYRTDQEGSIMFKIKNNKLKIETCIP